MESSRNPSWLLGFGEGPNPGLSPLMIMPLNNNNNQNNHSNNNSNLLFPPQNNEDFETSIIKAKILSHPHYPKLLSAYINCQKVGAPPEVVARLEEACSSSLMIGRSSLSSTSSSSSSSLSPSVLGGDPSLDQFMEAYCEMLTKYEEELSKPYKEAMLFLSKIDAQFKSLSLSTPSLNPGACGELERNGSSEEDVDAACENYIDPQAEDRELKGQLLRKYSGYLGNLKQEFLKKRKKGKLPKEARQQLLEWWNRHYKWPYPSESQKLALAESTGLDQKQINNWFINQRKRHWKPADELEYVVMGDAPHPHYFLENGFANPFPLDCAPALL